MRYLCVLCLFSLMVGSIYVVGCGGTSGQSGQPSTPPPRPPPPPPSIDRVLHYKGDLAGAGANLSETTLTTANVNVTSFGRLSRSAHLDGSIYTQTLFVRKLAIAGGTHSVIFLGTENDSVYALDADDPAKVLWKRSFIDPANGITPADGSFGGRTGIGPVVGVTGTPVIDPTTQTLYVRHDPGERHHVSQAACAGHHHRRGKIRGTERDHRHRAGHGTRHGRQLQCDISSAHRKSARRAAAGERLLGMHLDTGPSWPFRRSLTDGFTSSRSIS